MKVLAAALVGLSMSAPLSAQADEITIEQRLNKQIDLVCIANGHALPVRLERQKDGTLTALDQWADATVTTTRRAVAVLRGNDFLHISGDMVLIGAIDGERIDGECVDLRPLLEDALWSLVHDGEEMGELVTRQRQADFDTLEKCKETVASKWVDILILVEPRDYVGAKASEIEANLKKVQDVFDEIHSVCR
ncbi:hypothetical protein [Antarcticimicrobium sediminis]|uniref:Uncharacterized protein n=1 Tax=Antarcticimicrobium sediminis TaxID=2546227 RepID=A0A4R5F0R8_9RHOB|nr:hypothetical protein [Antarcticimicrobium sediminis]TDE40963.1 hypothetical protein E1B25_01755 [Antarcticimicrobium sediminis]